MQNKIDEEVEDAAEANAKAEAVDYNMIQKEINEKTKMLELAEKFGEDVLEDVSHPHFKAFITRSNNNAMFHSYSYKFHAATIVIIN